MAPAALIGLHWFIYLLGARVHSLWPFRSDFRHSNLKGLGNGFFFSASAGLDRFVPRSKLTLIWSNRMENEIRETFCEQGVLELDGLDYQVCWCLWKGINLIAVICWNQSGWRFFGTLSMESHHSCLVWSALVSLKIIMTINQAYEYAFSSFSFHSMMVKMVLYFMRFWFGEFFNLWSDWQSQSVCWNSAGGLHTFWRIVCKCHKE